MTHRHNTLARLGLLALIGACGLTFPACRGDRSDKPPRQFLPDMDDSPKFKPQSKTEFFADGRAMRPTVFGTVAYGEHTGAVHDDKSARIDRFLKADAGYFTGKTGEGASAQYVADMPALALEAFMGKDADKAAAAAAMLDRGQDRFKIYCSVCHGFDGKGYGMVGLKWSYGNLATFSFLADTYSKTGDARKKPEEFKWRDGFLFWTIRNGVPKEGTDELKMPSYAHALSERDAWAVVAYIRTMQDAYNVPLDSDRISPTDREKLKTTRPSNKPAAGADPAGTPPAGGTK